ncbi:DUF4113 domain-containing protein [Shewanella baltica]|uniref:DUF4113 domain-containing protein n=1 Tax=Shewanella baltica TaxID=62322 RepID=UPI003D08A49B
MRNAPSSPLQHRCSVNRFSEHKHRRLDLFYALKVNPALIQILDSNNQRYGAGTLLIATQGIAQKWNTRPDMFTPHCTTG